MLSINLHQVSLNDPHSTKIEKSKISEDRAAASKLFLALLLKPILPLKVDFSGDALLGEVQILKIEFPDSQPLHPLTMRYLNGITRLPSLATGHVESIVQIIVIHFDAILLRQDLDALEYDLLDSLPIIVDAHLDEGLVVAKVDLEILVLGT